MTSVYLSFFLNLCLNLVKRSAAGTSALMNVPFINELNHWIQFLQSQLNSKWLLIHELNLLLGAEPFIKSSCSVLMCVVLCAPCLNADVCFWRWGIASCSLPRFFYPPYASSHFHFIPLCSANCFLRRLCLVYVIVGYWKVCSLLFLSAEERGFEQCSGGCGKSEWPRGPEGHG